MEQLTPKEIAEAMDDLESARFTLAGMLSDIKHVSSLIKDVGEQMNSIKIAKNLVWGNARSHTLGSPYGATLITQQWAQAVTAWEELAEAMQALGHTVKTSKDRLDAI